VPFRLDSESLLDFPQRPAAFRYFFSYTTSVAITGYNRGSRAARHTSDLHCVYMAFALRGSWQCEFTEVDSRTPLPRKLTFASADKVAVHDARASAVHQSAPRCRPTTSNRYGEAYANRPLPTRASVL